MNLARVLLVLLLVFTECLHSPESMLVFYVPLRLAGLFRPMRTMVTLGRLRRRMRLTRRVFRLFAQPMLFIRRDGEEGQQMLPVSREDDLFDSMKRDDPSGCLLRLICELHATEHQRTRSDAELSILEFFNDPENQFLSSNHSSPFFTASRIGKKQQDVRVCAAHYRLCPYTSDEIMQGFAKMASLHPLDAMESVQQPHYIKMDINFYV